MSRRDTHAVSMHKAFSLLHTRLLSSQRDMYIKTAYTHNINLFTVRRVVSLSHAKMTTWR